jgi:hypothetical protein
MCVKCEISRGIENPAHRERVKQEKEAKMADEVKALVGKTAPEIARYLSMNVKRNFWALAQVFDLNPPSGPSEVLKVIAMLGDFETKAYLDMADKMERGEEIKAPEVEEAEIISMSHHGGRAFKHATVH